MPSGIEKENMVGNVPTGRYKRKKQATITPISNDERYKRRKQDSLHSIFIKNLSRPYSAFYRSSRKKFQKLVQIALSHFLLSFSFSLSFSTRAPPCNVFLESYIVLTGKIKMTHFLLPETAVLTQLLPVRFDIHTEPSFTVNC